MSFKPWKQLDDSFQNNNMLATSRLIPPSMTKEKKNEYSILYYDTKVKPIIMNDHSEPVSDISTQSQQRLWYFPHQCISKKTDKNTPVVRLCVSLPRLSLIDRCHQEPNRSNTLSSICLGFR